MNSKILIPNISFSVEPYEIVYIQVDDMANEITVSGRVYPNAEWKELKIIDSNYNFIDKIVDKGLYIIDVNGLLELNIKCNGEISAYIANVK